MRLGLLVSKMNSFNVLGNLLLTEDKKKIKLADFGLAREETMAEMTTEAGTYRWMAPEVLLHNRHLLPLILYYTSLFTQFSCSA